MNNLTTVEIKKGIQLILKFINCYKYITDACIIEFFSKNHWETLPKSWQSTMSDLQPQNLEFFFSNNKKCCPGAVFPLSFLVFKYLTQHLSISRSQGIHEEKQNDSPVSGITKNIFRKHITPKKKHEIEILSKIINKMSKENTDAFVIDMGSGQGHLSRVLTLEYDLPTLSVERNKIYLETAEKYDAEFARIFLRTNKEYEKSFNFSTKVLCQVESNVEPEKFIQEITTNIKESNQKRSFILTGLHACGDLSATMIRLFANNEQIIGIVSVACCYMNITTQQSKCCYPMSEYLKTLVDFDLSFKARSVACHAIENYVKRLKENDAGLKMHCYRAVLECLIQQTNPNMIRTGVQTIKKAHLLPFQEYVGLAFKKLDLAPNPVMREGEMNALLSEWKKVVVFYSVSLMLAPVVESLLLLDRLLYLRERGFSNSKLVQLFDPRISPRCHAIISTKAKN